jgi:MraZ protein
VWFTGEHQHTLDDKGRVILPAPFRNTLEGGVVLSPGKDHCISIQPQTEFDQQVRALKARIAAGEAPRSDMRILAAKTYQQAPDSQGRLTIPPTLREYAGLERDLMVTGALDSIEIWDLATWQAYEAAASETFADVGGVA